MASVSKISENYLRFQSEVPAITIAFLTDFIDVPTHINKQFRVSLDNVSYGVWQTVNSVNINALSLPDSNRTYYIEYKYDDLEDVSESDFIDEDKLLDTYNGQTYGNSIFAYFLGSGVENINILNWSINVVEKLYLEGNLATYMERNKGGDDTDFIDFWRSITSYFSLYVVLAAYFADFSEDQYLFLEYLYQRGLFACHDISLVDLTYLVNNFHDEIRQRGTLQIIKAKNSIVNLDESESQSDSDYDFKEVDGELLRLICYEVCDEFIFNFRYLGLTVNNRSPLYRGLTSYNVNAVKGYEQWENVRKLDKYPLLNSQYISKVTDGDKKVIQISGVGSGEVAGLGSESDFSKAIKVDPSVDYEITFRIKQEDIDQSVSESSSLSLSESETIGFGNITFGCWGYDCDNNKINFRHIKTGNVDNLFFERELVWRDDKYYFIRGIIFSKNKYLDYESTTEYDKFDIVKYSGGWYECKKSGLINYQPDLYPEFWRNITSAELNTVFKTNIGLGNNLKFTAGIKKIIPYLVLDNTDNVGGSLNIYDFKVKPVATPYSTGFVNVNDWVDIWMKNRNDKNSKKEIVSIIKRYLLPYNCEFASIFIEEDDLVVGNGLGDYNSDFNSDFF